MLIELSNLRHENKELKNKLKMYEEWQDEAFTNVRKNMGETLECCLKLGEKKND